MSKLTEQDHNAGIQYKLKALKSQLYEGLTKDEVVIKMKTECLKTTTHIDHLCLEIIASDEHSFVAAKDQTLLILKRCGIKISSSKPRNLKRFDEGNILVSQSTGRADRRVGSIKTLNCDFKFNLELNGYLCALIYLTFGDFLPIYELASLHTSKIRRLDVAFDDLTGTYDLRKLCKDHSASRYNSKTGCKPKSIKNESESGVTRYIGSRNSDKRVRVYDKSSEVGLKPSHPFYGKWTRHEVVFKNQGKISIPLDALLNPDGAFVAAYPKAHPLCQDSCRLINFINIQGTVSRS